jgi:hypothetical protein
VVRSRRTVPRFGTKIRSGVEIAENLIFLRYIFLRSSVSELYPSDILMAGLEVGHSIWFHLLGRLRIKLSSRGRRAKIRMIPLSNWV